LRSLHDQRWTDTQFRAAEWVTIGWSGMVHLLWHRHLAERWKQRRAAIATATGRTPPARLVLLPETAVLAEIFCDPQWRRQMASSDYGRRRFYLHVAHRLGLPSGLASGVQVSADPLGYWVDRHKVHHRGTYAPLGAQQSQPGEHSMSSCVPQRERRLRRLQPGIRHMR
jgi:hypothetical protein